MSTPIDTLFLSPQGIHLLSSSPTKQSANGKGQAHASSSPPSLLSLF